MYIIPADHGGMKFTHCELQKARKSSDSRDSWRPNARFDAHLVSPCRIPVNETDSILEKTATCSSTLSKSTQDCESILSPSPTKQIADHSESQFSSHPEFVPDSPRTWAGFESVSPQPLPPVHLGEGEWEFPLGRNTEEHKLGGV